MTSASEMTDDNDDSAIRDDERLIAMSRDRHRSLDPSQAWAKVSIAEAARMSAESMQIVARSKELCLRSTRMKTSRDPE